MKIVRAEPPLMDEIDAAFHVRGKPVIFAWLETIYCPPPHSAFIEPAIVEHEEVHSRQHAEYLGGVVPWWREYIRNPTFRLAEEIPAHRVEYQWFVRNAPRGSRDRALLGIANRLSGPLYGRLVDFDKARLLVADPKCDMPAEVVRNLEGRLSTVRLREAFNLVCQPRFTCGGAMLKYWRDEGPPATEWQVLTFTGNDANGSGFDIESDRLPPGADLMQAARDTAQALLNRETPLS